MAEFSGIYLPFWNFDATTKASWKAEVGHKKTETYYSGGKRRTRTKIVWKWESGKVQLPLHDVLIEGTTHVSSLLVRRINNFDLHQL